MARRERNGITVYWILVTDIRLPLSENSETATEFAQKRVGAVIGRNNVLGAEVYRRSVDARRRGSITTVWSVAVQTSVLPREDVMAKEGFRLIADSDVSVIYGKEILSARPIVVGFGPAGMFSALLLAENGYRPIVLERGDDTEERIKTVERFYTEGKLDPESNIQFGAGGAGTFSDGKLVTRINDNRCRYVLKRFADFGAPKDIMTKAKPHIGTDKLTVAVSGIRDEIVRLGGEIRFRCAFKGIVSDSSGNITAVKTSDGEIPAGAVILATGHSARDVYSYLKMSDFCVEEKAFSVGVRIEHLRKNVENALFGEELMKAAEKDNALRELLGHAEYQYSYREGERGVYTFCMCPGGEVVAGASEDGGVVVNGMSRYARDGRNSNCAVCVSVTPDDCVSLGGTMEFCRAIERKAYSLGGGGYSAPIQTVGDFLDGRGGLREPKEVLPTYMGGKNVKVARLEALFPVFVSSMLKKGIRRFGKSMKGFDFSGALLTGAETRTGSPYRILRLDSGVTASYRNFYPCGEGAGYAGGITSAAVDGISRAVILMERYAPIK